MLADDGHRQVRAVLAAELVRQRVPQVPGTIGAAAHLREQLFPLAPRPAAGLPVRARPLAAMIEVLHVVAFERLDLTLDKLVELAKL